jgi:S1-C subfamily serine protease
VLRDAEQLDLPVSVTERDDDPQRFADLVDPEKNQVRKLGILGIEVTPKVSALLPDLRKPYGVVVAARIAASPVAGELQPGDVIHEINGEPIATIVALREALDKKADAAMVFQVERDGKMMYLVMEIE